MTDLTDFGIDVDDPDQDDTDNQSSTRSGYGGTHSYRQGRCRAIKGDGTRCRSPAGAGRGDCCHTHSLRDDPVTIDEGPRRLIEATTRQFWEDVDNEQVRDAVQALDQEGSE